MQIPYLFPTFLMLHLTALVLMAGTTLVDYMAYTSLWKSFERSERPEALLNVIAKLPRITGIGAALLILSGIGVMALTHGVFGEQLWFRIKFGLVVVLILNGLLIGRRQGNKLRKLLQISGLMFTGEVSLIKSRLNTFHLLQLLLFVLIIFLSAFKFN
ncbi:hypothetical protein [Mucilaginibacter jinjuensis]|uniref:Membrane protein DUF2214 n=1 Tax=Mucilaginibacter jinjuensis TaxID=1176721 RepID=A0ABY7T283_9SPHI|nr:hypothetical protein [Mucilaginibacter jinjuensis]WCT09837.1 hypothetical protein PQO05_13975 [Mucilaginibacter jinjuensis]